MIYTFTPPGGSKFFSETISWIYSPSILRISFRLFYSRGNLKWMLCLLSSILGNTLQVLYCFFCSVVLWLAFFAFYNWAVGYKVKDVHSSNRLLLCTNSGFNFYSLLSLRGSGTRLIPGVVFFQVSLRFSAFTRPSLKVSHNLRLHFTFLLSTVWHKSIYQGIALSQASLRFSIITSEQRVICCCFFVFFAASPLRVVWRNVRAQREWNLLASSCLSSTVCNCLLLWGTNPLILCKSSSQYI